MNFREYFVLCLMAEITRSQFSTRRLSSTPCDVHGTALVEQFFNVIFAEFQHSPPTCVCAQMCADQPTYCYPNGCFKKADRKKETSPVSPIQHDAKTTFLVNYDRDVVPDLVESANLISSLAGNSKDNQHTSEHHHLISRNNPLKELLIKYKRIPKLQMKYNLREQVKHTRDKKTEVDVSKTRWPINKQISRHRNYQRPANYLASIFPEINQIETPKYFKRYLTKRENQIGMDISALYLYDSSNFSLETIIDNLIERGLESDNNTLELEIINLSKSKGKDNNKNSTVTNIPIKNLQNGTNGIAMKISFNTNATGNNKNKTYKDNSYQENSTTAAYFEMITTLSEQIEKQNNKSMAAVGYFGSGFGNFSDSTNIINSNNNSLVESIVKTITNLSDGKLKSSIDAVSPSIRKAFNPLVNREVKKTKQRIVRKLRNKKHN